MWEQSLSGLIKALRASRHDEAKVVQAALGDIASEIKSNDWELKAGAVLKLTYLDMLGYPHLSQHAFQVIECMSCPRFHIKQIGYLAASHAFAPGSQVLLLTHNLIKKDLTSNTASQPVALLQTLSTLPSIISSSSQLSHDLEPELLKQLSHSKSAVRRAAVLVLGSLWRSAACPSESAIIDRLGDKLLDQDPSVVNATVNVMLELARTCSSDQEREPFLRLAPECFELLTTSNNNWMLIKLVKLFALLTPIEPRLVRKLIPPITNLISTTPAMSLLYECIHAVIAGGMLENNESLAKVCVQKLAAFLNDDDQNLRYIALLAINKLVPSHPHLITNHSSTILRCVDDDDLSIRSRALDLLEGMVDKHNLPVIVRKLLSQLTGDAMTASTAQAYHSSPAAAALSSIANGSASSASGASAGASPAYKVGVVSVMLRILQQYNYGNVTDFEWLVDLLIELAYISTTLPNAFEQLQRQVGDVLIDVTARARAIRPYAVHKCIEALPDNVLLDAPAWIVGEYCTDSSIGGESSGPQWSHAIRTLVQAGQVHAAVKVYAKWAAFVADSGSWEDDAGALEAVKHQAEALRDAEEVQHTQELLALLTMTVANLQLPAGRPKPPPTDASYNDSTDPKEDNPFAEDATHSEDKGQPATEEVAQEDAGGVPLGLRLLKSLYLPELNPVNPKAQGLVGEPEGLDLNAWIVPSSIAPLPLHESSSANEYGNDVDEYGRPNGGFAQPIPLELGASGPSSKKAKKSKKKDSLAEEGGEKKKKKKSKKRKDEELDSDDVDNIPIVKLDMSELASGLPTADKPSAAAAVPSSSSGLTKESKKKKPVKPVVIDVDGELPPESAMRRPSPAPTATPQTDVRDSEAVEPELKSEDQTEQEKPSTPTPIVVKKVNKDKKKKKKPAAAATGD